MAKIAYEQACQELESSRAAMLSARRPMWTFPNSALRHAEVMIPLVLTTPLNRTGSPSRLGEATDATDDHGNLSGESQ